MKTSTKILVIGFFVVLLLVSAVHLTWYAKYKSGNFELYNVAAMEAGKMQSYPNISVVSLLNVQNASIVLSDEAQVSKMKDEGISYRQQGDTLVISSSETGLQPLRGINIPARATLKLTNSSVSIRGNKSAGLIFPTLDINNSTVTIAGGAGQPPINLHATARDSSTLSFKGIVNVDSMSINLSNSLFEYNAGDIRSLSISTDSLSRISLPYKNLVTARIVKTP